VVQTYPARSVTIVTNVPPPSGNTKETPPGSFGWRLRRAREAARLTQTELADKLGWGQNVISRYELNVTSPSTPERQQALDEALGLKPGTVRSWLPRRVSRQRGGDRFGAGVAAFFENLTEGQQETLVSWLEGAERQREARERGEEEAG
jgi:transcriptional regulator with XRE-family HTH domain